MTANCECNAHAGWCDNFPERHQVAERVDPGDGRTKVTWCLACHGYLTKQWADYAEHMDEMWRSSQGM